MTKPTQDPYHVLGVDRDADDAAVKKAYRRNAAKAHPDAGGDKETFGALVAARDILLDPKKRERFDKTGEVDDETTQTLDVQAHQVIAELLNAITAGDDDHFPSDLVAAMKGKLRDGQTTCRQEIAKIRKRLARQRKLARKFKATKQGGPAFLRAMAERPIINMERSIASGEETLKVAARALELLDTQGFDPDPPKPDEIMPGITMKWNVFETR
jgi:curved DNA-binding protein CbpA